MTSTQLRPTRRSLVRGAAWSVPVISIAAAAPAFAASPCDAVKDFRLNWGTAGASGTTLWATNKTTATHTGTATVIGPTGTSPVIVSFSSVVSGAVTRDAENLTVSTATDIGDLGANERGLNISHGASIVAGRNNRQDIGISFDRSVTGLSFTITDVDSSSGGWFDRVELTGGPTFGVQTFTEMVRVNGNWVTVTKNRVLGNGTNVAETSDAVGPWRYYDNDSNLANAASNRGNVTVTYAGTIPANTPIVLSFWSTVGGGNQRIFLSDFTFSSKSC